MKEIQREKMLEAGQLEANEDENFDPVPEITKRHFEEAMQGARRSVTDHDIRKYEMFATSLQTARGFGEFKFPTGGIDGGAPVDATGMDEDDLYS